MVTQQDVERWAEELTTVADRIAPRFKRPEIRSRAAVYLQACWRPSNARTAGSWRSSSAMSPPRTSS
ncbi:hypothetical protein Pan44_53440 [Caulifigura coniformis]|uniref:Uncharacterized protein n=1 Tax=Caulifigura coniformis TaxID=2527983 RepID=A0A517SMF1_9PLAN|nr:hypothetical protein [Caulifigura coniformis]QDT57276.1 hypothetical protein Pan44_53440 [Caulifigura coniformis]